MSTEKNTIEDLELKITALESLDTDRFERFIQYVKDGLGGGLSKSFLLVIDNFIRHDMEEQLQKQSSIKEENF